MTFEELQTRLSVEGFDESPSQLHGLFSGRIAGGERLTPETLNSALIECLASEEEVVENALPSLRDLYNEVVAAFERPDFGFQLLLPGDSATLEARIAALSEWCQYFLSGLGDSGLQGRRQFSTDFVGAMSDLAAIARVDFEGEAGDGDETDLVEVEEYVRVAAMLIYSEINDQSRDNPAPRTLH